MRQFVLIYLRLAADFLLILSAGWSETPTLGMSNIPRLLLSKDITSNVHEYDVSQNHTVIFYHEDSGEMYVGGTTGTVLKLDADNFHVIENLTLETTGQQKCSKGDCKYVITVIEELKDSLLVCGTNGLSPLCWKLPSPGNNQSLKIIRTEDGTGISPFVYTHNSLSLTAEGDLFAAAPLDMEGRMLQFRRKADNKHPVWMYDGWVSEPTFISASWVQRKEDPDNEKIYIFFREKNSYLGPEADRWITRVARVCKIDEGGPKRFFQSMWTSFLKARLVCGFPDEHLYFSHLLDVFVLHAKDWRDARVYALFTNSWNSTAVCIYSIAKIEDIFETSGFKGYSGAIPSPRPGTCTNNSMSLPLDTVIFLRDHPEMSDWAHSMHNKAPFYVSSSNYTKITVDRVQAADETMYNILLLATDSGKIHKVLEADSEPFIISETQLSSQSAVQSMKLDSKRKKLVVGLSEKIVDVDLQRCREYNKSCAECVLARDPYCAWTKFGCSPTVPGGIQNIMEGNTTVCPTPQEESAKVNRSRRETPSLSAVGLRTNHSVPLRVPFYLTCPIDSYHAVYTWEHHGNSSPCLQMQSSCLHLIPAMAEKNYGDYKCVSKERDYTKVVTQYHLTEQLINFSGRKEKTNNIPKSTNFAAAVVPQSVLMMTVLVLAVVSELFTLIL